MNANLRNFALWVIIVLLLLALFTLFQNPGQRTSSQDISFSQLLTEVDQGHVRDVVIQGPEIHGTFTNGSSFQTYSPNDPTLVSRLYNGKVQITAKPPGDNVPWFVSLLVSWLPFIALIGVWIFLSRQMQGGAGKAMGFGKSRAKMLTEAHGRVTFEDVAGVDEAKQDLQEIVEFLRDPGKYQRLGGRIPRGVLLVGPPGTGKTLIARAVAGEANVPFFTISGSDFVEMFVGVGASRVRDMFEQAKKNAPCIIFIDEIDAVGRHRGAGLGGGNDEREQTLNQLLVEMDGFEANEGVIRDHCVHISPNHNNEPTSTFTTKPPNPPHESGTLVIVLVPNDQEPPHQPRPMACIVELSNLRAGEGHHTPTHYVPEPETYYLISHVRRSCGTRRFRVGEEVVLDHNLGLASFNDDGVREKGMDGPFGVVGIAYSDDKAGGLGHEAEYEV